MHKQNKPALVVFGKRARKQPRAAWFAAADTAIARWVAQRYGMSTLRVTPRVAQEICPALAEWQLASKGEPIIPSIKAELLERLTALAADQTASGEVSAEDTDTSEAPAPSEDQLQAAKLLWGELRVGSLVLAQEDNPEDGWWEAIVLARHKNTYTICYRDHPEDGLARREVQQLALIYPIG
jgi:hypothetical protein